MVDVTHEIVGVLGKMRVSFQEGFGHLVRAFPVRWRLVACVVEEEDGVWAGV